MGRVNCDCVILAAGLSTRMKRWKMVLPYGDSTVIETAVSRALSVVQRIILVTGFRADEMEELFAENPEVFIHRNHGEFETLAFQEAANFAYGRVFHC